MVETIEALEVEVPAFVWEHRQTVKFSEKCHAEITMSKYIVIRT